MVVMKRCLRIYPFPVDDVDDLSETAMSCVLWLRGDGCGEDSANQRGVRHFDVFTMSMVYVCTHRTTIMRRTHLKSWPINLVASC